MSVEFQREYLVRLPLPLAQLYSRAYNGKDARSRHDNAFYLLEALVKLSAAPAVAAYLTELRQGGARVPELDRLLAQLALPSLGQWLAILRELVRHFGQRVDAAAHPLGHVWIQLDQKRSDLPGLLALYQRIKNGPDGRSAGDKSCSLLDVFNALVQYRNGVFGHGGPRFPSFYEQEMGPLLFPAVNELLAEGVFDFLGPRGSRLVYITEIRTLDEKRTEVGLRELVGLNAERAAPLEMSPAQAAGLLPNRVCVWWPGLVVPLRLDPLLIYRESDLADEVLLLNRDRNARQVEYLSYTTGRGERDSSTVEALAELLSTVTGQTIDEQRLEEFAQQSLAETPSVEALFGPMAVPVQQVGNYELLAEIGHGGMGVVYLARQLSLGRLVALKMLPSDLSSDPVALARFQREIRHLARCEHPGIVKVLDSGTLPDGRQFYAMEYVPGSNLESVWCELSGSQRRGDASSLGSTTWARAVLSASQKQRSEIRTKSSPPQDKTRADPVLPELPLPPLPELPSLPDDPGGYTRRVVMLMRDAALALQAVHDRQVVHRDIKPANLMLTPDGSRVVLMDFGLAKGQTMSAMASKAGGLLGTLRYAAPEQLAAARLKVGPAADIRGLGVTLWELLTRRRLFEEAEDETQLAQMVHDADVPRLRAVDPTLDRDLEAIVARATERRASDRIQTSRQLADYLNLYLDHKALPIRPASAGELLHRWMREHKPLVASSAAALAVIIATIVAAFVLITHSRNQAVDAKNETEQQLAINLIERADAERTQGHYERGIAFLAAAYARTQPGEPLQQSTADLICGWGQSVPNRLYMHDGSVNAVAFSPDGRQVLTGSGDKTACLWDIATGKQVQRFEGHTGVVTSVAFSPDGRQILTGSWDNTACLWDIATGKQLKRFEGHTRVVTSVAFSPDGRQILTGSWDNTACLWDIATGKQLKRFEEHTAVVTSVAFSPDGRRVLTGSGDNTACLWDIATGKQLKRFEGHTGVVTSVAFSPDGRQILTGSWDNTACLWDTATGKQLKRFEGHTGVVTSVAFSPDGRQILTGSMDNTACLWDIVTGKQLKRFEGHTKWVESVAFSPDGRQILTGSWDNTACLWDIATGKQLKRFEGHTAVVTSVAFSPDGRQILTGSLDNTACLWDIATGKQLKRFEGHTKLVESVAFSPDGRQILTGSWDNTACLWDIATGEQLKRFEGHTGVVTSVAFSPDGRRVLTGSLDNTACLWNIATGKQLKWFEGHTGVVTSVAFSPDGRQVLTGSWDNTACLWDTATGKQLKRFEGHTGVVTSVAFSHDGRQVLTGSWDNTACLWDIVTGKQVVRFEGHTKSVKSVAFSPDGRQILTGSWDNTACLWDIVTGKQLKRFEGHTGVVTSVAFSPDGRQILTGSWDKTACLWDALPHFKDTKPELVQAQAISQTGWAADELGILKKVSADEWTTCRDTLFLGDGERLQQPAASEQQIRCWHEDEAAASEKAEQWSAVVFHSDKLIEMNSADKEDLATRRNQAAAKLAKEKDSEIASGK